VDIDHSQPLDEAYFERLFREQYHLLCRTAYRLLRDADSSRDIVQDVFARLWKNRHQITVRGPYAAYLYRATIHQSLNYLKSSARTLNRERRYAESTERPLSGSRNTPDAHLEVSELEQTLHRAIDLLSPACREVFILSRFEEMPYKEIAQTLGVSVNTVEKHMVKALASLRAALKNR
jgi:RNA polymerase sigma-70 factor, ECF subfamily